MKKVLGLFICFVFLNACVTNPFNPYPNIQTNDYQNAFLYKFGNLSADKLIISIEGSGWMSTLGQRGTIMWHYVTLGAQIVQASGDDYTVVVPEKWRREPDKNWEKEYYESIDARLLYTMENLIEMYAESINTYLSSHNYSSIYLVGSSEGALILPFVYEKIIEKDKIKCLVSVAGGGLSVYESYQILINSRRTPRLHREAYSYILDTYGEGIPEGQDPIEADRYGTIPLWLTSLLHIRAFEEYRNINIPVLFIHGERDYNVAVESTRYIQENLPDKPFEYIYYRNMEHSPNPWAFDYYSQWVRFRNDIVNFIRNIDE
ncbi:MAG: alpha/beta hydrolase [Treponema sp.]|nr:alpha/beta hydrolase [Treponema sp.]